MPWHLRYGGVPGSGVTTGIALKQKKDIHTDVLFCVITERLERSTGSLEGCCSIQLSYVTIA